MKKELRIGNIIIMEKINQSSTSLREDRRIANRKNKIQTQIGCPNCGMWLDINNVHSIEVIEIETFKTSDNKVLTEFYIVCPFCASEINFAWSVM